MSDMMMTHYASEEEMITHYTPQMPIRRIGYPETQQILSYFFVQNYQVISLARS